MSTATTQIIIAGKDNLSSVVADAGRRMGTELEAMQRNVLSLQNAFVGLAGAVALNQIRQSFTEYDTALRDMGKVTDESMDAIAAKIREVPAELGTSAELIRSYYQVISAGVTDPIKAMETLVSSSEAAKAAHVQQAEVIKGITKVMAGYAGDVKSAAEAADLLFTIEKQGQTSFAELIPIIGDVAAISKQLGVEQTEMGAALAAVTQTAGSTSQAATQYRMMLVNLMKPTKDMQAALDSMGVSSGKAAIEQFGLAGTLQRLQLYADRSGKSVAKLFESSESLLAVAALSRGEFAQYNANLQAMDGRAGSAAKAFAEWQKSAQAVDDLLRNTLTNTLVKIGEKVMPTVNIAVREFAEFVSTHDDEIAGVFGEMAEFGQQIGTNLVPALQGVGDALTQTIIPGIAGITSSASDLLDLLSLVPEDYQSAVGGGLIGYVLLGPKRALIGATIAGIKTALDDLWGNEAASKQEENIGRVLAAAEDRLEAAQRRLRQAEKLPGNNSGALQSAQSDIDHEMELIGRLTAAKVKVVGVEKTFSDTWQAIERDSMKGVAAVATGVQAVAGTTNVAIANVVAQSKAASTALTKLQGEIAKLTMSAADFEHYKIDQEFAKIAAEIGAAHPLLQKWVALRREEAELIRSKSVGEELTSYFETIDKQYAATVAQAERAKEENERILLDFADRHRETVLGETEFKKEQIDKQAEIFRKAGADEIAVAQWVAQEKLAISRDWQDGAKRALLDYADEGSNAAMAVESVMTTAFQGMEDVIVEFVKTGKFEFADLVTSINAEIARLAFKDMAGQMYSFLGDAMGGGKSSSGGSNWLGTALNMGMSALGSYFGGGSSVAAGSAGGGFNYAGEMSSFFSRNAKGGVYDSPSLSAYSGGVYNSPQLFAFAKGAGVFGEAGPEAIMPLKRGPDGSLGVQAGGGNSEMTALLRELLEVNKTQRGTKVVNAIGKGAIANELSGSEGEQVIFNHIRRNPQAIRRMLGL